MNVKLELKRIICFIPIFIFGQLCKGQTYRTQQNQIFAYNILSNGLMGGIGGMINRPADEKWHKALMVNFAKGCLGGLVKYSAKSQTYYLQDNQKNGFLALPNRLFFFAGHSIVMNASKHKQILETYYCNLWGADIRYQIKNKTENSKRFKFRLSLYTMGSFIGMKIGKNKLDIYRSLEMGLFYFELNPNYSRPDLGNVIIGGIAGFNTIAIRNPSLGFTTLSTVPHELIHTYQAYDFFPITSFYYNRFLEKKLLNIKWCKKISSFTVLDLDAIYNSTAYFLQPKDYFKNFFEFEADHFARRRYF